MKLSCRGVGLLVLFLPRVLCFHWAPTGVAASARSVVASPPVQMAALAQRRSAKPPLIELLEKRRLRAVLERAAEKPSVVLELLQDAGFAGVVAYFVAFIAFYSVAGSIGEVVYHTASGSWVDPRVLLMEDGTDKAETIALLASFYLLCKPFAPLRLGGALVLTPDVNRFIQSQPALVATLSAAGDAWDSTIGVAARAVGSTIVHSPVAAPFRRELLKGELLELVSQADGGITPLDDEAQQRLGKIASTLLPPLNPTSEPARSEIFSGEWECMWTDEKELKFARSSGLFGLPWVRTSQSIDIARGVLVDVLEFEDSSELRVTSAIIPDETNSMRFNFACNSCSLRWKSVQVSLPPVGRGWGRLLYLDHDIRIQQDSRGKLLIAEKVGPPISN